MKFCLQCGNIVADNSMFKDDVNCCNCKIPFENDDVTSQQFESFSEKEKEEYTQKLYNIIKNSEIFQEDLCEYGNPNFYSSFWFEKYESLTGDVADRVGDDLRQHMQAKYGKDSPDYQKAVAHQYIDKTRAEKQDSSNAVKCIYCQSTNTKKITVTSKAVHTALFGIWAMGRNSKNYHCNSCNSDF